MPDSSSHRDGDASRGDGIHILLVSAGLSNHGLFPDSETVVFTAVDGCGHVLSDGHHVREPFGKCSSTGLARERVQSSCTLRGQSVTRDLSIDGVLVEI